MAAPQKKTAKKKFVRKTKKRYPMVQFTLPAVYGDTPFVLPALASMPLKVQQSGRKGDMDPLFDVCREAGVDDETLDALAELDGDEFGDLMDGWSDAGEVPAGKSSN